MKVWSIPCSGVPVMGPNEPGSSDFAVLAGAGLVDADGPLVGGALVAQAQDVRGLAVSGQQRGDVAVEAAVTDEGSSRRGQPTVTWAARGR
jgi:hypothetical protein